MYVYVYITILAKEWLRHVNYTTYSTTTSDDSKYTARELDRDSSSSQIQDGYILAILPRLLKPDKCLGAKSYKFQLGNNLTPRAHIYPENFFSLHDFDLIYGLSLPSNSHRQPHRRLQNFQTQHLDHHRLWDPRWAGHYLSGLLQKFRRDHQI